MSKSYTDIKKRCQFCNYEFMARILEYPSNSTYRTRS